MQNKARYKVLKCINDKDKGAYMKNIFESQKNKYGLSKTLRFELKPVGDTINNLDEYIKQDQKRAIDYEQLKKILNEYHKSYIDDCLKDLKFDIESLNPCEQNDKDQKKDLETDKIKERKKAIDRVFKDCKIFMTGDFFKLLKDKKQQ